MKIFRYSAYTKNGKKTSGILWALSKEAAIKQINEKSFFLRSIKETSSHQLNLFKNNRLTSNSLIYLTHQMSQLLSIGYTVDQTLTIIEDSEHSIRLKLLVSEIKRLLQKGQSLAQSLATFSSIFSSFYLRMVHIGETSGELSEVFTMLYNSLIQRKSIIDRIRNILIYPTIVLTTGMIVIVFLVGYVIPVLAELFTEFDIQLPLITRLLFSIGLVVKNYWLFLLGTLIIPLLMVILLRKTMVLKDFFELLKIKFPIVKIFYRYFFALQFSYSVSILLQKGLSLKQSLNIVKDTFHARLFIAEIAHMEERLSSGNRLQDVLSQCCLFPPGFVSMISIGESRGDLGKVFSEVSQLYRNELETKMEFWVKIIEPLIFVVIAFFVAILVFSVLLPLFNFSFTSQ
ncbi:type II secretion system F family protein [Chlamydiota bacterium]